MREELQFIATLDQAQGKPGSSLRIVLRTAIGEGNVSGGDIGLLLVQDPQQRYLVTMELLEPPAPRHQPAPVDHPSLPHTDTVQDIDYFGEAAAAYKEAILPLGHRALNMLCEQVVGEVELPDMISNAQIRDILLAIVKGAHGYASGQMENMRYTFALYQGLDPYMEQYGYASDEFHPILYIRDNASADEHSLEINCMQLIDTMRELYGLDYLPAECNNGIRWFSETLVNGDVIYQINSPEVGPVVVESIPTLWNARVTVQTPDGTNITLSRATIDTQMTYKNPKAAEVYGDPVLMHDAIEAAQESGYTVVRECEISEISEISDTPEVSFDEQTGID